MANSESTSGLSNSFTDLMTSLAVIFILLLCASWNNVAVARKGEINTIVAELRQQLEDFRKAGVEVETDPKDPLALVIIIPEDLLVFAVGKDDIPEKGKIFLREFITRLAKITLSENLRDKIHGIIVEGHADKSGTDAINLPLSQRRSMSVVTESLNVLEGEGRRQFIKLLSASGRGSVEPYVEPVTHQEVPDKSRRVVFKIRMRSFEQKDFQTIIGTAASR